MGRTQYIGARYVPLFADPEEWTSTRAYEALTIVLHNGNSYTSKQAVPVGIDISNSEFWALTGNYNAQVEQYRQEVSDIKNVLPISDFDNITVKDYIDNNIAGIKTLNKEVISICAPTSSWGLENSHGVYYSDDGITFNEVFKIPEFQMNSNALFQLGDTFYHSNGNYYRYSKDLVNWSEDIEIPITSNYSGDIWAGSFYNAINENKIYFMCAVEYQAHSTTIYNECAALQKYFKIVAVEVEQQNDGSLLPIGVQFDVITSGSHIDPYAVYTTTYGCVFACKNEQTCRIEIYTGATLLSLSLQSHYNYLYGVEAPQLITDGVDTVDLYVDVYYGLTMGYNTNPDCAVLEGNVLPRCSLKTTIFNHGTANINYLWEVVFYSNTMAHPGYLLVTKEVKNILVNYNIVNSCIPYFNKSRIIPQVNTNLEDTVYYLTNIPPFWIYTLGGTPTQQHSMILQTSNNFRVFKTYSKWIVIGVNTAGMLNNDYLFFNETKTKKIVTNNLYEGSFLLMYDTTWGFQIPNVNA